MNWQDLMDAFGNSANQASTNLNRCICLGPDNMTLEVVGGLVCLVTKLNCINLAPYRDPYLAIHPSLVDPLPHWISAAWEELMPHLSLSIPPRR